VKFGHVVFETYERTDRQTDTQTCYSQYFDRTHPGGEVTNNVSQSNLSMPYTSLSTTVSIQNCNQMTEFESSYANNVTHRPSASR